MRKHTVVRGAVLCVALVAGAAGAQTQATTTAPATATTPDQRWTVDSGQTVGDGANVVRAQVAWPGLWLDYVHGLSSTLDIGGRVALNWGGPVGEVNSTVFNIDIQLLLRDQIAEIAGLKLALTFNPGVIIYTSGGATGINIPVGAQLGIPFNDQLTFNASFELPFYLVFGNGQTNFVIPLMFGGGAEYRLQPNLLLTFKLAMGPSIPTLSGTTTQFALQALAGVAYKF
ncbi:MAG: hypothetical protein ACLPM8_07780 [Myxococcaceae bacterium]